MLGDEMQFATLVVPEELGALGIETLVRFCQLCDRFEVAVMCFFDVQIEKSCGDEARFAGRAAVLVFVFEVGG